MWVHACEGAVCGYICILCGYLVEGVLVVCVDGVYIGGETDYDREQGEGVSGPATEDHLTDTAQ